MQVNLEQIQESVKRLPYKALKLAHRFWPGSLTLVLEKTMIVPDVVTLGLATVAVRVSQHALTLRLLRQLALSLTAPSANPFGYISPNTPQHLQQQLGMQVPYILEGGVCTIGVELTIVGFTAEQPIIYLLGGVSIEAIEHTIGPVQVSHQVDNHPQASGMLANHYATQKPMIVGELPELLTKHATQRVGILAFKQACSGIVLNQQIILSPTGNLDEAVRKLFAALRTLNALPIEMILATFVPNTGIGRPINDRLKKAATHQTGC